MYAHAAMLGDDDTHDPHTAQSFGREIADLRKQAGYSNQRQLADAAGVSESMISHVETGRRLPSKDTLASVLGAVNADEDTRRRLETHRRELATSPLPPGALAALQQLVTAAVDRLQRQVDELERRIAQIERRRGR